MICSLCHTLFAQDKTPTQPRYIIEVDSQVIKATPYEIIYEKGGEMQYDENEELYTDKRVYKFIPKSIDINGKIEAIQSLKTTIFFCLEVLLEGLTTYNRSIISQIMNYMKISS